MIYLRQSIYREESVSLEQQETACRAYCERKGYTVVAVCADPGVSASKKRLARRKGVQEAFVYIDDDLADVLVPWKGNRVARNRLDDELAKERVAMGGGRIESATEPNDPSATGRFTTGMLAEVAVLQAGLIGEDWRATHARRRDAGDPAQGGDRYGYFRVRDDRDRVLGYWIDPEQEKVVKWIYEQVINGRGAAWIARELNQQGIPNRLGQPWKARKLYGMLDSGFAAGLVVHHPRDRENRKIGEPAWSPGRHPPIISEQTWQRYRAARRSRAGQAPGVTAARYPLTGLVRCGDCGASMWAARAKVGGTGYTLVCGRWMEDRSTRCVSVARHRAEAAVKDWLADLVADVERAAGVDTAARLQLRRAHQDRAGALKRVSEVNGQLNKLSLDVARGVIPESSFIPVRDELLRDLERAEAAVESADAAMATRPPHARATATNLLDQWETLEAADVRNIVATLLARVEVFPPERPHGRSRLVVVPRWDHDAPADPA